MPQKTEAYSDIREFFKVGLSSILILALILGPLIGAIGNVPATEDQIWQKSGVLVQGVLGALTLGVLVAQACILAGQRKLMERQHIATHRPKLRIRNVVVHKTKDGNPLSDATLFTDDYIIGQCYVTNTGGADACVVESHIMAYANQMGLPMERPYEGKDPNNPLGKVTIPAGKSCPFLLNDKTPLCTHTGEPRRALNGEHPFFIMGWVSYSDENGITRRTAFCRRWDTSKRRFVRLDDDPDYEHEE